MKVKKEKEGKVIAMSKEGISQTRIAEMLHMSKRDVSQILRENDIGSIDTDGNEDGTTEDSGTDKEN